ncbi:hypothetical protein MKK64_17325 [Methylobacterium sp. E-025]|uniref:hypothetical protein n=1 Tax=Methylobacterium sp. E-025 TaxID=2836561 RepID=UPI001FB91F41|nr:hypothetical protein [Methylobacterium sp. E-025]MCJ2112945.1 hypothetical protein [Methylobacterium sp. E-025]
MTCPRTLTARGVATEAGFPWATAQIRAGILHIDSHGLPRPVTTTEGRHFAARLLALCDEVDARGRSGTVVSRDGL